MAPDAGGREGRGEEEGEVDVFEARFISLPRACALYLSLFFLVFLFFCPCFTPPLDFFFHPFWSTLDCSATTNQDHLTGNTPRTRHLCPRHPRRPSASHFCFPSSLPRPLSPRSAAAAAAAIAIRSLTNLFDKSPRLIGLTTRPRLFFPSAKFTVITKSLVAPPPLPSTLSHF